MEDDLPFRVEYAKSGRASCKGCKSNIAKDTLRLAVVVQSSFHDGKDCKWYHYSCFFTKQKPKSTADIAHFDNIRYEDQEKIKKKIEEKGSEAPSTSKAGKKRPNASKNSDKNYQIEYAKSSRSTCKGCEIKILKDEVRVSKKDFESDDARRFGGGLDRWYHFQCFVKLRKDLEYFDKGDALPGFHSLSKEDKSMVEKDLPNIQKENDAPATKKLKSDPEDLEQEAIIKKQNKKIFAMRDALSSFNKPELIEVLELNKQYIPEGISAILDHLSDVLYFGALYPCEKCNGNFVYKSGTGYKCTGDLTEWTKCTNIVQDPKRKVAKVTEELLTTEPKLFRNLKVNKRVFKFTVPTTSSLVKKEEDTTDSGPKLKGRPQPLKNMYFFIVGKLENNKDDLKKEILKLGGNVTTKITDNVIAVISNTTEVDKMSKKVEEAKEKGIHVISEDFVEEAKDYEDAPIILIKKKSIAPWGDDPSIKIANCANKSGSGKNRFEKSAASGKVKLQVKGGGAVDPDSELQDVAHVYQSGNDKYTVTLGITDIQAKKNSYYKLQILKHDKKKEYWLFRSWGRTGTSIGGKKTENLSLEGCISEFERLYEEKSGNRWKKRHNFVKVPHKLYPIDIDHGDEENSSKLLRSDIKSNLKKPIQDLMQLIFDVENMKRALLEFEIDVDKMPLGKLSKKQIQKAYSVLKDMQDLFKNGKDDQALLIDASNRFYTLIPHNFGTGAPKILQTIEEIQQKCEMLDALLEMEIAYKLLHDEVDSEKNPLDAHYEQLNTELDVLDKDSKEFKFIQDYLKNTHADTHRTYDLEIEDVYTVNRQGEDKRYKPFKKLNNRKLLWHGSRITNFAGILSQGLRIAPPEAPVTGYMFGKGIYFADMVSKSANYCCTNRTDSTGLLLLCEVALGNMYERYMADYIEKLPKGRHSTFGRGATQPNPEKSIKLDDGVEVPCGEPVLAKLSEKSNLLYNEYIVYDVAQVKTKYLLKVNFKYKY